MGDTVGETAGTCPEGAGFVSRKEPGLDSVADNTTVAVVHSSFESIPRHAAVGYSVFVNGDHWQCCIVLEQQILGSGLELGVGALGNTGARDPLL